MPDVDRDRGGSPERKNADRVAAAKRLAQFDGSCPGIMEDFLQSRAAEIAADYEIDQRISARKREQRHHRSSAQ